MSRDSAEGSEHLQELFKIRAGDGCGLFYAVRGVCVHCGGIVTAHELSVNDKITKIFCIVAYCKRSLVIASYCGLSRLIGSSYFFLFLIGRDFVATLMCGAGVPDGGRRFLSQPG
jgi:hypothetical protein